ncbi:hypothetical protein Plav_0433 [Parvibaculum lavamentivorans DS-1]|uniref:Lipoprotein n=1 Tax=Parvibaculum lavamentivorans (strain DS-1 / DSM 13023 / NCIMB 13966) TaxID=402881 RepID=A7HQ73_PARL1|nr:hypothetical protein [Parvibaculum lavamentivorans]ABS62056.1 hypothetical protein Plav_0433 [Parvibaculum lavamentivorans DS-1]
MKFCARWIVLPFVLVLGGCVAVPDWRAEAPMADAQCLALLTDMDEAVAAHDVGDAGAARIKTFPWLRIDRFLASFRHELSAPGAFEDWVSHLRWLDARAREIEASNLPLDARMSLAARHATDPESLAGAANRCGDLLLQTEVLEGPLKTRDALVRAAVAPSHYNQWQRAIGLYPLTNLGAAIGYGRWKDENLGPFARDFAAAAPSESTVVYVPAAAMEEGGVSALVRAAPRSALGLPKFSADEVARLAAAFAPVFEIETQSDDDRLGSPFWQREGGELLPAIDVSRPAATTRLVYTRFEGRVLPQLVYTVWFPARPLQGSFDLLGGRIDGFIWRVTLDEEGEPLIYDAIHACGCYHMFFPVAPLRRVPVPEDRDMREAPLVPKAAPRLAPGERIHLRLAAVSHYLLDLGVRHPASTPSTYELQSDRASPAFGERSLPLPEGGRRSFYGPTGIVPHTERLERFTLWPLGIESPGAMRQWGTHATAFVGERHFDDPFLFDKAFAR